MDVFLNSVVQYFAPILRSHFNLPNQMVLRVYIWCKWRMRKIIIHIINYLYNSKEFQMVKHGDICLVNIGNFIFQMWKFYLIRYLKISSVIWIRSCSIIKTRIWWRSMQSSYHFLWRSWSVQRGIDNYWTTTNLKTRIKTSLSVFNIFKVLMFINCRTELKPQLPAMLRIVVTGILIYF